MASNSIFSTSFQTRSNLTGISKDTVVKSVWSDRFDNPLDKMENPFLLVGLNPVRIESKFVDLQKKSVSNKIDQILYEKINERALKLHVDRKIKSNFDWEARVEEILDSD